MSSNIKSHFVRNFERFLPSVTVAEARQYLALFAMIVDNSGMLLTLLDLKTLNTWADNETLEAMRDYWPPLYVLPESEAINIVDVARFFKDDLAEQPDVPGIVLVDDRGQPSAILSRGVLFTNMRKVHPDDDFFFSRPLEKSGDSKDILERNVRDFRGIAATETDLYQEKELQVKRYGRLQFPAQVSLNRFSQLIITVNREEVPGVPNQVELGLTRRKWPLKLIASLRNVQPNDFLIRGSSYGIIEVPREGDSQPLVFTLIPQSTGKKKIRVLFEQVGEVRHNYVALTSVQTEVVTHTIESTMEAEVLHAPNVSMMGEPPDVTIYIEQIGGLKYHVSVRTAEDKLESEPRLIDEISFPLPPDAYLKDIINDLDKKTNSGLSPAEFDEEVKIIGNSLYNKLFHEDGFKAFYWNYMRELPEPSSVQIISQEPFIPWEILRPFRLKPDGTRESDELYFCQRFVLSRWLTGPPCGSKLPLLKVILVVPPSDLPWVKDEVKAIIEMPGLAVTVIQDKQKLQTFFKTGEADVVHFACHGAFQATNPGRSKVLLGKNSLQPEEVVAENCNFARVKPLVFLNACYSGHQGIGLTNLDGWAKAFTDAGVGFFIGSVWKTTDRLAYEFAKTFYGQLQSGKSVGEAMRLARQAIFKQGDATYLSYTLYANPRIRARSM